MTRRRQPTVTVATAAAMACLCGAALLAIGARPADAARPPSVADATPTLTSAASTLFVSTVPGTFTVTASGAPVPSLSEIGALPDGITWTDNGDGTATLTGTPRTVPSDTQYPITLRATNCAGTVTQSFVLTVAPAPLSGSATPPVGTPATTSSGPTSALAGGDRLASTPDGLGYWIVGLDGSVAPHGSAGAYGAPDRHLNKPIVGVTATPDGQGYWLVASDGGVFSFGDARFHGSTGTTRLNKPIVGMAATPDGRGYWLVASDGGIFSFGDAAFYGSTGDLRLNQPVIGMTADRAGHGYWLVASDGGIFTFGDAGFYGSGGSAGRTAVGLIASPSGSGYALIDLDGTRNDFGW